MKIKTLLIVVLSLFTLIPAIIYCVVMNINMNTSAETQYNQLIEQVAVSGAKNLAAYLESAEEIAVRIGYDKNIISGFSGSSDDKENALASIGEYCGSTAGIRRMIGVDASNKVLFTTDNDFEYIMTQDEVAALPFDSAVVAPVIRDRKAVDYDVLVKTKVDNSDSKTLLVYFSNEKLKEIMSSSVFPTNGRLVIIDSLLGLIDTDYLGKFEKDSLREFETIRNSVVDGKNLSVRVNYEVSRSGRISYTIPAGKEGWYVCTLAESSSAFAHSGPAAGSLIGISVFLIIALIAVHIVFSISVTKPLTKIEDTLQRIRKGDHDARLEIMGRNEYSDIARGFNDLIDNIIVGEHRYRTIVEMSDSIVFEWSFKSNEITFSNNFNKKFSYRAPSDHFSDSFLLKCKVHPDDNARYRADLEKLSAGEEFRNNEYRWKNIYGDYIWISINSSTIRDKDNEIIKIVGVINDIDRAKKSESILMARASYDSLTGVYNRETIENIIDNEISKLSPESEEFSILFVDIDDFKIYNDKYSHATGDQVLKFTADSIMKTIKEFGFVGRYGGDEFVICIRNSVTNPPARIAQELLNTLKEGFVCDSDDHLSVNVSIGINTIKDSSKRVDEIIAMADEAMYRIKKNGKSSFGFF